ncbi:MAG: fibronectin type III domain-containing protein, partial [Acidobacteriota bacterium]|nr:fibronectin type III domain-containing protein [Acidobacteriota bacterium]
ITAYTVTASSGSFTCATTGATTCVVNGLTNGQSYTFSVTATNAVGTSTSSSPSSSVTPASATVTPTAPGTPSNVTAVAGDASATISWSAPSDGGSTITAYTVTASSGSFTCATTGATTCVVNGLTNGQSYTFSVTATNAVGTSTSSSPSSSVTPSSGPFTINVTSSSSGSVSASQSGTFTSSVSTDDTRAGAHLVFTKTGGSSALSVSSSGVISVTSGATLAPVGYTITVKVVDSVNNGSGSFTYTLNVTQDRPTITSATSINIDQSAGGSLSITASEGLSSSASYLTSGGTSSPMPTGFSFVTSSPTSGTLSVASGVAAGTYVIVVSAVNGAGTTTQRITVSVQPTGTPTNVVATTDAANGVINVSWTTPATATGVSVTPMDVTAGNVMGSAVSLGLASSYQASGLITGHAYKFVVTTTNGVSTFSATSNMSLALPASSVTNSSGSTSSYSSGASSTSVGSGSASGSISVVAQGQGQVIIASYASNPLNSVSTMPSGTSSYDIQVTPGSVFTVIDFTVCGVSGGTVEWYDASTGRMAPISPAPVAAATSGCYDVHLTPTSSPTSLESDLFGTVVLVVPPVAAPTLRVAGPASNVVAVVSGSSIVVNWTAPTYNGGTTITSYVVTASPGGATCVTTSTSCAFSNLTAGTSYAFSVVARNGVGAGAPSAPSALVTAATVPSAPSVNASVGGATSVAVSVVAPDNDGGAPILSYTVSASPGGASCVINAPATSCEITDLVNGLAYTFSAVATNAVGTSPASSPTSSVTPLVTTNLPSKVVVVSGTNAVLVSWSADSSAQPNMSSVGNVAGYVVSTTTGFYSCVAKQATSCVISGLVPGVTYQFAIQAFLATGERGVPVLSSKVTLPRTKPAILNSVVATHVARLRVLSAVEKRQLKALALKIVLNGYHVVTVTSHSNVGGTVAARRAATVRWAALVTNTLRANVAALGVRGVRVSVSAASGAFAHATRAGATTTRALVQAR